MAYTQLSAQLRTGTGTGVARKLRHQEKIPAVLYGNKTDNILLTLENSDMKEVLKAGSHTLIQIKIVGDKKSIRLVMLKDIQGHPLKRVIYHVDFLEVSEKQSVEVALPISLIGEPVGVKRDKGILEHILRELHVTCPANAIPEKIEVDITELALGDTVHVSDLVLDKDVTTKDDPNQSVASIVAPKEEEEETVAEEEGVEGVEGEEGVEEGKEEAGEEEKKASEGKGS